MSRPLTPAKGQAMTLNTEGIFASEAQQSFVPGDRIYAVEDTLSVRAGAEGTYTGHHRGNAVIGWDTPSGTPYTETVSFAAIRQLYR